VAVPETMSCRHPLNRNRTNHEDAQPGANVRSETEPSNEEVPKRFRRQNDKVNMGPLKEEGLPSRGRVTALSTSTAGSLGNRMHACPAAYVQHALG
jgi:hypothetical protein